MTFDNDPNPGTGVTVAMPPGGAVDTTNPFLGQWSYVKSATNSFVSSTGTALAFRLPAGCTTGATPFEVGARHVAAPPWEGRMVPFAPPNADTFDLEVTNDAIQKVLLGTRPYGATPIEGMLEDARDYYLFNPEGPNGTTARSVRRRRMPRPVHHSPHRRRSQPRPPAELRGRGGQCPFNKAASIVTDFRNGAPGKRVTTYVIGFSVNGSGDVAFVNDGFPTVPVPIKSCKQWYTSLGSTPTAMQAACTPPAVTTPPKGSTAAACCELNEIAYFGTNPHGQVGPFFAETQADLVLSFGRVLGGVSKSATTRTLPGYAPAITNSGPTTPRRSSPRSSRTHARSGPERSTATRSDCAGAIPTPRRAGGAPGRLVRRQPGGPVGRREATLHLRRRADDIGTARRRHGRRLRTYDSSVCNRGSDRRHSGVRRLRGLRRRRQPQGHGELGPGARHPERRQWRLSVLQALEGRRARHAGKHRHPRALTGAVHRRDVGLRDRQVRRDQARRPLGVQRPLHRNVGNLAAGFCSVTGGGCTVSDPNACAPPTGVLGEVCVPECSALGAIYVPRRSSSDRRTSTSATTPTWRSRQRARAAVRRCTSRAQTASSTPSRRSPRRPSTRRLRAVGVRSARGAAEDRVNYPTGQQILLDGTRR